jgi:hypothetical protein
MEIRVVMVEVDEAEGLLKERGYETKSVRGGT